MRRYRRPPGVVAVGPPNVHLSRMLCVSNPSDLRFLRGIRARFVHGLLVLAIATGAFTGAAAQDVSGFEHLRAGRYDDAVKTLRSEALDGNAAALSAWVICSPRDRGLRRRGRRPPKREWSAALKARVPFSALP